MKLAILTPTFHAFSGIDRVVQLQAEQFVKQGHEVTVIALEASLKGKGYRVISLGMPRSSFWQRLYRLFFFLDRKAINKYAILKGYDSIIAHFYPMTWLAYEAKKYYAIPYTYWDHGINTTGLLDSPMQKCYMWMFKLFNNWTIRTADTAISVSKYLSQELWNQSRIKSKVKYNRIDWKRFNKKVNGHAIRSRYSLEDRPIFLYVGRLAPHKGIHLLIDAFKETKRNIPNAVLLIVGKETFKGYASVLKRMVKKTNVHDVIFAGFVHDRDLPQYYGACDVYTTCSQWEGFNLPAAEAQACGKPVVAFDVGSHKEIVKKGRLVQNKDLIAFSKAMIDMLRQ